MFILATGHEKICLLACCRKRKKSISVHWWVNGKRRGKTWGTGVVGRQWMSASFTSLSTAVCILKLFTRWMRSFFSLLEMKQHVVKWLSHSLEPFKDHVLNAVLVNLVAKIWWLLFIMLLMMGLVMIYAIYYYTLNWSNIIKIWFSTISLLVC